MNFFSIQLGMFEEALQDAEKGRRLAEERLKVTRRSIPGFVKTYLRKGVALNGIPIIWKPGYRSYCYMHHIK